VKLTLGLVGTGLLALVVSCGGEFTAQPGSSSSSGNSSTTSSGNSSSGTTGSTGGGTSSSGSGGHGGSGGSTPSYGEHECGVATNINAQPSDEPNCTESEYNCVADYAGQFGSPGTADGSKSGARFVGLYGLVVRDGFLYASTAHAIRKISIESGQVTTLAGSGMVGDADGVGTNASFSCPRGLWVHGGLLYVADSGNNSVRTVDLEDGNVVTLPFTFSDPAFVFIHPEALPTALFVGHGSGAQVTKYQLDGTQTTAIMGSPQLTNGSRGMGAWKQYIYTADPGNHIVRKMYGDQLHQGYVGATGMPGLEDGGNGTSRLDSPSGLVVQQDPLMAFIADRGNHAVRRFQPGAYQTATIAGNGEPGHKVDYSGDARLFDPTDVAIAEGFLFIAEGTVVRRIRLLEPTTQ